MHARRLLILICTMWLGACALTPRRPPPPDVVDTAVPVGFSAAVRLFSIDRERSARLVPQIAAGLQRAAGKGPVNVLALSGGGAGAAFGAGALLGLSKARARPEFQLVTGVSAGALIAPFAFLGPRWDLQLRNVIAGGGIERLQRSAKLGMLGRFLFPRTAGTRDPLSRLVAHAITGAMIDAIGRQAASGRKLIVATTDLDSQETVLWDMTAIAASGGPRAHALFRKVLVASASVPGVFPPVLIHVREGGRDYDELHVDGSVTTPLFIAPLIAHTLPDAGGQLAGANIYVIVSGRLAMQPQETPINAFKELTDSFSAAITYKTRDALELVHALARRDHMRFRFTSIPVDYPAGNFLDFGRAHLEQLLAYGEGCAARGLLWTDFGHSIARDVYGSADPPGGATVCPAADVRPPDAGSAGAVRSARRVP